MARQKPGGGKADPFGPSGLIRLGTDHLPPRDRLDFWQSAAGARMDCIPIPGNREQISARLRALVQDDVEFMDYACQSFHMVRDQKRCSADGRDEISIGLVLSEESGAIVGDRELPLSCGDLYVIDFGHPVSSVTARHHELAVALPRRRVEEAIGLRPEKLNGVRLPIDGMGHLLASHMKALSKTAATLSPGERHVAMQVASALAIATLRTGICPDGDNASHERFAERLYVLAMHMIETHCSDHLFTPATLATMLKCSRARLYRVFQGRDCSVGGVIWEARLRRARQQLQAPVHRNLAVSEVAFQCGFLDQSSFSRMFKRRYGLSPRDARNLV